MWWRVPKLPGEPGEYYRLQASRFRAAATLARSEGDEEHAKSLEYDATRYDADELAAIRVDREERAKVRRHSFSC